VSEHLVDAVTIPLPDGPGGADRRDDGHHQVRAPALAARVAPRLAPSERPAARARLEDLVVAHPTLGLPALAGRAVVALEGLLSSAGVHVGPDRLATLPARLAPERALALATSRAATAPPELGDGSPVRWASEETGIAGLLGLWRARRENGTATGEWLFACAPAPRCRRHSA